MRGPTPSQIGHGADLIKVYADWQHPTLKVEEMRVVVEEAHRQRRKVAAHATRPPFCQQGAPVRFLEHRKQGTKFQVKVEKRSKPTSVRSLCAWTPQTHSAVISDLQSLLHRHKQRGRNTHRRNHQCERRIGDLRNGLREWHAIWRQRITCFGR